MKNIKILCSVERTIRVSDNSKNKNDDDSHLRWLRDTVYILVFVCVCVCDFFFWKASSLESQIPLKDYSGQKFKLERNDCIWILLMKEWGQHNGSHGTQGHCSLVWSQLAKPQELSHKHCQHIACSGRVYLASVIGALTKPQK